MSADFVGEINKFVPVTKAKNDLLEIIRQVEKEDNTIAVTKNGVPAAVILSMRRFEGLWETLDILSDKRMMFTKPSASCLGRCFPKSRMKRPRQHGLSGWLGRR